MHFKWSLISGEWELQGLGSTFSKRTDAGRGARKLHDDKVSHHYLIKITDKQPRICIHNYAWLLWTAEKREIFSQIE